MEYSQYQQLVKLLLADITPEYRSNILNKLVYMNNQLLNSIPVDSSNTKQTGLAPWGTPRGVSLDRSVIDVSNQGYPLGTFPSDPTRSTILSSKKKDVTEIQHPSTNINKYNNNVPIPLNMPASANEFHRQNIIDNNNIDDFSKEDILDIKLQKLNLLYKKILVDKRQRQKNKIRHQ